MKTHYDKIMKLQPATSRVTSLRYLLDNVNKHLRSLQVLGQDIDSELFVSVLWSKIPQDVLLQLQLSFGVNNKWSVSKLVDMLNENVIARERTEIKSSLESRKTINVRATIYNDHLVLVAPREIVTQEITQYPHLLSNQKQRNLYQCCGLRKIVVTANKAIGVTSVLYTEL